MTETALVIAVWLIVSASYVLTGAGFVAVARALAPFGWPGYVLGTGYLLFGIVGIVSVIVAASRAASGSGPAYTGIGYVGYFRLMAGAAFSLFQAGVVGWTAYTVTRLTPAEMQTVREAARVFARLRRTVEQVTAA